MEQNYFIISTNVYFFFSKTHYTHFKFVVHLCILVMQILCHYLQKIGIATVLAMEIVQNIETRLTEIKYFFKTINT